MASGGGESDRGSLVLAMLVTLVATSIAALLLPVLLTQTSTTRFELRRTQQLAAAQSGIQVALARLRAAGDAAGVGLQSSLPCATVVGSVLGTTGQRYSVSVTYYDLDPQTTPATALAGSLVRCFTSAGGVTSLLKTPKYALITSSGTDVATGDPTTVAHRTVTATYVVKTTNANVVGGLFHVYQIGTSTDLCLDAGSAAPAAGAVLTVQPCTTGKASQTWGYLPNLTVMLTSTQSGTPMCVDGGATPAVAGTRLTVAACSNPVRYGQIWSMNDWAGMQGTDDGRGFNAFCWNIERGNQAGSAIALGTTCGGAYTITSSWQPDAAVGAGASGEASGELVNFSEFGRCLDVTTYNVSYSYMIAWPCKQSPDPANVGWNQRWSLPAKVNGVGTGRVSVSSPSGTYCLTSPLSTAAGRYVTMTACKSGAAGTTWTVRGNVGSYAASYQIQDTAGYCLQPTDPNAASPDFSPDVGNGISKIIVAPCSADPLQKWNAPPDIATPSLKDQQEN